MGTILQDVKKFIGGIADDNTAFDADILMYINGAFTKMTRAGVGPEEGIEVVANTTWESLGQDNKTTSAIKNFVTMDVKIAFDSSTISSFVLDSYKSLRDEFLWTLNNYADHWNTSETGGT